MNNEMSYKDSYKVNNKKGFKPIIVITFLLLIGFMVYIIIVEEKSNTEKVTFLNKSKEMHSSIKALNLEDNTFEIKNGKIEGETNLYIDEKLGQNGKIIVKDNKIAIVLYNEKYCAIKEFEDYDLIIVKRENCKLIEENPTQDNANDNSDSNNSIRNNYEKTENKEEFIQNQIDNVLGEDIKIEEQNIQEAKKYKVTFVSDNGENNIVKNVYEGKIVEGITNPKNTGYVFAGWYYGDIYFDSSSLIYKDLVLKAKWEKVIEKPTSPSVNKDLTPPTVPTLSVNELWTNTSSVLGSISGSVDNESGIAKYEYSMSGATTKSWTSGTSFSIVNAGETKITVRATNNDGLVSSLVSKDVRIDRTLPTCSAYKYRYGDANEDGLIDMVDLMRIISFINKEKNPTTIESYQSDVTRDGLINQADLDAIINVIVNEETNFDSLGYIVEIKSSDTGGSGLTENISKIIKNEPSNKTYTVYDKAGNKATCSISQTINLDSTAPLTPKITSYEPWANSSVGVSSYGGFDAESGILRYEYSMSGATTKSWTIGEEIIVNNDGVTTVSVRAVNGKGLASPSTSTIIKIDKTLPVCTFTKYKYGDPNKDGLIDIMDLVRIIKYINKEVTPTRVESYQSDVTKDGLITQADLDAITNVIVNEGTNFDSLGYVVEIKYSDVGGSGIASLGEYIPQDGLEYYVDKMLASKTVKVKDYAGNEGSCFVSIP